MGNVIDSFVGNIKSLNSTDKCNDKSFDKQTKNSFRDCLEKKNITNENKKNELNNESIASNGDDFKEIVVESDKNIAEDNVEKNDKDNKNQYDCLEELMSMFLNATSEELCDYKKLINESKDIPEEIKTVLISLISNYTSNDFNSNQYINRDSNENNLDKIIELLKDDSSIDDEVISNILVTLSKGEDENTKSPKELINYIKIAMKKDEVTDSDIKKIDVELDVENSSKIKLDVKNNFTEENDKNSEEKHDENKFLMSLIKGDDTTKSDVNLIQAPKVVFEPLKDVKNVAPALTSKVNVVEDIIKSVKFMKDEAVKEIVLKVVPRSLGEVVISLSMDEGNMKANVTTTNIETYHLLANKIEEMNKILNDFKVESFELSYMNNSEYSDNSKEGSEKENFHSKDKSSFNLIEDDEIEEMNNESYSNINMLA